MAENEIIAGAPLEPHELVRLTAEGRAVPAIIPAELDPVVSAIMAAATAAFDPRAERGVSKAQTVQATAAVVAFLEEMMKQPERTSQQWREAILELKIVLGR